jgi:hypothetical protein
MFSTTPARLYASMSALARRSCLVDVQSAYKISANGHKLCWLAFQGLIIASCFAPPAFADDSGAAAAATVGATPGVMTSSAVAPSNFRFFPKAPVESGLSVGFRFGYAVPYGNLSIINREEFSNPLNSIATSQIPIWFDAGYLFNPYFYVGAYASYGVVQVPQCGPLGQTCSGNDVRVGVDAQLRFLGRNALQPWIGLSFLGYERISVIQSATQISAYDGIEWVSPQAGFDYKILPSLSAGFFLGVSLGDYLRTSNGGAFSDVHGTLLHGWEYLGARINYDLHL